MELLQNTYLSEIFARLDAVSDEVGTAFGDLNGEQLNWRPKPKQWSIAQCLEHLMKANKAYYAVLVQVADGMKRQRKREKLPVLPDIWGRFLRNSLSADSKRKLKAPE
ncbi:MAG: DinB family protein, partial [Bacteroidota bacterium]